jgi:hypothetical protein
MTVRALALTLCAAALFASTLAPATSAAPASLKSRRPRVRLLTPRPGDVLTPGQVVTVSWVYATTSGQTVDPTWCEQEVYLSVDGGKSLALRLTPALDAGARSFEWTVPNTPTRSAILDIHFGCELDSFPHEVPNPQLASRFAILPANHPSDITLTPLPRQVASGSAIAVGWQSTVANVDSYETQVSFDRGATYSSLGTSTESSFEWTVPADYVGVLVFRVVATTSDGATFESTVDPRNFVRVVKSTTR